jgi:hypothetical protein
MSDSYRDSFRKKISELDDEFIDLCANIGTRVDNIIGGIRSGSLTQDEVVSLLEDLKDEVW